MQVNNTNSVPGRSVAVPPSRTLTPFPSSRLVRRSIDITYRKTQQIERKLSDSGSLKFTFTRYVSLLKKYRLELAKHRRKETKNTG